MSVVQEKNSPVTSEPVERKKQIFLDQDCFNAFQRLVRKAAEQVDVEDENIPLILEALEPFGQGLPRSRVKGAIFKD